MISPAGMVGLAVAVRPRERKRVTRTVVNCILRVGWEFFLKECGLSWKVVEKMSRMNECGLNEWMRRRMEGFAPIFILQTPSGIVQDLVEYTAVSYVSWYFSACHAVDTH